MDYRLENVIKCLEVGSNKHPDNFIFTSLLDSIRRGNLPNDAELRGIFTANHHEEEGQPSPKDNTEISDTKNRIRDLRCNHLILSGVRAYPTLEEENTKGFGVDFTNSTLIHANGHSISSDGVPISTILLGSNGTGKTSVFTALEFICKGESSIANAHGYRSQEDQQIFLKHQPNIAPNITLICNSERLTYPSDNPNVVAAAFFCCEDDIQVLENGLDYTPYIISQVGFDFIDNLGQAINRVLDSLLKPSPEDPISAISKERGRLVAEVVAFINWYEDSYLKDLAAIAKDVIPGIMNDYLRGDCGIEANYYDNSFKIELRLLNSDIIEAPRRYFNTFRFKLFVVAMKIALACCVKIIDKVNFPIVIDDVFDACDFQNKQRIRGFIRSIVDRHSCLMEEKGISGLGLQLIFLTQDDIIAQNLYQGIRATETRMEVKLSRLYHPNDARPEDDVSVPYSNGCLQYRSVTNQIDCNYF